MGFAFAEQARHNSRPNRVHLRYGLIVHLRLLSTPPRGDAVTFGYEVPEHFDEDLHLADSMQLQAHSATLRVVGGHRGCRQDAVGRAAGNAESITCVFQRLGRIR